VTLASPPARVLRLLDRHAGRHLLGVVTAILPVVAPVGTDVVICWSQFTVKVADTLLKVTLVASFALSKSRFDYEDSIGASSISMMGMPSFTA
jgi:hypothetical protein